MKKPSWKPVRCGQIFCSTACGRGCTIKEYETALRRANLMARSLGARWERVVHENLGWHASATMNARGVRVCYVGDGFFYAFVADGKFCEGGRTARAALSKAVASARIAIAEINAAVAGL